MSGTPYRCKGETVTQQANFGCGGRIGVKNRWYSLLSQIMNKRCRIVLNAVTYFGMVQYNRPRLSLAC